MDHAMEEEKMKSLVDELMKSSPDRKKVRKLAKELNIPLSNDLLTQTNEVLNRLETLDKDQREHRL